jgi:hypothetical protein
MTLNWLALDGLEGAAADMTVVFSTGPVDPLLIIEILEGRFEVVRISYGDVSLKKESGNEVMFDKVSEACPN